MRLASAETAALFVHDVLSRAGAVWVHDRYNYNVQHNPTPPGIKNRKGNAYEIPHPDKRHRPV